MGRVAFTPEVDTAYKTKQLWQQVVRVKEKKKSLRDINRWSFELEIISPLSKTLTQAREALKKVVEHYESLKALAAAKREDWLWAKLKQPGITDKEAQDISRLIRVENQRAAFRRIRHLEGMTKANSVCHIEVPTVDGDGNETMDL